MKLKSILLVPSALLIFTGTHAQLHVSTNGQKYTLLEEATGTWCGYCPDGAEDIERDIEPTYPKAIIASFHGPSGYGDPLMLTGDPFCSGTGYTSGGFPCAIIDRNTFTDVQTGSPSIGLNRSWDSYVATALTNTPKFNVSMKSIYNDTAKVGSTTEQLITVYVTARPISATALTGKWYINAYVVEDSISSASYPQDNYARPQCTPACNHYWQFCGSPYDTSWFWMLGDPIVPATKYAHMNVVRAILSTNTTDGIEWGDPAFTNPNSSDSVTIKYTYVIPAGQVAKNMKVIGLVQKFGTTTSDRAIENVIEAKVRLMPPNATAVPEIANTMTDIELFPNPARNSITVKGILENPSDTRITIYSATGQVVTDKEFKAGGSIFAENIPLNNVSNGIYFMNIINNGQTVTKQFTVNK